MSPESPPPGATEAAPENRAQVAPDDTNAKSAKPMNEATDQELLVFMRDVLIGEAVLEWVAADERIRRILRNPVVAMPVLDEKQQPIMENGKPKLCMGRMNAQELENALALAWHDALNKLDSIELVVDHMKFRANNLRCKGILSGDPREKKVLEINE